MKRLQSRGTLAVGTSSKLIDLAAVKVACQNCSLARLCLPLGLDGNDLDRLDRIIKRRRPVRRGEHLFQAGDPFHCLYAVRSGSIKTYTPTEDGREQIVGFYLSGELLGLDAIESQHHVCAGKALETTSVCEVPYDRLAELSNSLPSLHRQIWRLMSREISHEQGMLLILGKRSADERLAAFLISLSERFLQRGFSGREFNLSMSRHDIANYLGLAVETVSRMFSRFQEQGLLRVERRHVALEDIERLRTLVGLDAGPEPARYS